MCSFFKITFLFLSIKHHFLFLKLSFRQVLLLECLSNLVLDSDDAKIQAMAYDVFLIIDLLIHRSYKVKNAAARLFSELFKHEIGRLASYHWPFFDYLTRGFNIEVTNFILFLFFNFYCFLFFLNRWLKEIVLSDTYLYFIYYC